MSRVATEQVKADAESRLRYQHNGDGLAYIQRYQDEAIVEVCEEVERERVQRMEEALLACEAVIAGMIRDYALDAR